MESDPENIVNISSFENMRLDDIDTDFHGDHERRKISTQTDENRGDLACGTSRVFRHDMREAKNEIRERQRVSLKIVRRQGASPNWLKNCESKLAKYAKRTKARHKRHEMRTKDAEANRQRQDENWPLSMEDVEPDVQLEDNDEDMESTNEEMVELMEAQGKGNDVHPLRVQYPATWRKIM
ncbi:hypothetical protein K505DRAFT_362947 [Melanomma pulvis-pyrius CBS 109.77]|uniref:Uncharacterized protein n=1 Tax=Melanomma pulvis-pyrius CBS 109.77 TaxID=1314802 RepID=A0A6A6X7K8_9PLEO|nr:hypothetical protein K505DRAFT_362947 [Melanomma pulvis-pyrius CBS 109.77]